MVFNGSARARERLVGLPLTLHRRRLKLGASLMGSRCSRIALVVNLDLFGECRPFGRAPRRARTIGRARHREDAPLPQVFGADLRIVMSSIMRRRKLALCLGY